VPFFFLSSLKFVVKKVVYCLLFFLVFFLLFLLIFHISSCGDILNGAFFTFIFGEKSQLGHLLDTPVYYLLEFGPLLVLGCIGFAAAYKQRDRCFNVGGWKIALGVLFAPLLYIFIRPPYPGPNNLQGRTALITFLALSLFSTFAILDKKDMAKPVLKFLGIVILLLGVMGNVYECLGESASPLFQSRVPAPIAKAFKWINHNTPRNANVQFSGKIEVENFGFFVERSSSLADKFHAELFLPDKTINYDNLKKRMNAALGSRTAYEAWRGLSEFNINYLMIDRKDLILYKNLDKFKEKKFFSSVYENERISIVKLSYTELQSKEHGIGGKPFL